MCMLQNEKKLEYDIAEARYNEIKIAQKVADVTNGGKINSSLLDPSELGKQLKDEIDRIKFQFAEEKLKVIKLKKEVCVTEQ